LSRCVCAFMCLWSVCVCVCVGCGVCVSLSLCVCVCVWSLWPVGGSNCQYKREGERMPTSRRLAAPRPLDTTRRTTLHHTAPHRTTPHHSFKTLPWANSWTHDPNTHSHTHTHALTRKLRFLLCVCTGSVWVVCQSLTTFFMRILQ